MLQSVPRKALMRLWIPAFAMLGLEACAPAPAIMATPSACASLIPERWKTPVPGADLPEGNTVGDWVAFGDAQTGRLEMANGRTADTIDLVTRCEARDADAVKKSRPRFLGIF